jgi:Asp-tRNA(Asn)/Glu-tRNA(Gln) amidotransferase A subunit family amidase
MGVQVIGAYGDDLRTLQAAAFVERVAQAALA